MSKGGKNSGTYTDRTGDYKPYLPPTMSWQRSAPYPYGVLRNWEPASGTPSEWLNAPFTDDTCDTTNNDATVTMGSTAVLRVGVSVTGTGIPAAATVLSITNGTTFELSANATASITNTTLTFTEFNSSSASLITNHWASGKATASLKIAHPMFGAGGTGTDSFHYNWHMDGGYPAGGNWMDNAVAKNPTHPTTGNRLPDSQTASFNIQDLSLIHI